MQKNAISCAIFTAVERLNQNLLVDTDLQIYESPNGI